MESNGQVPVFVRGEYMISTDKSMLDVGMVHQFLATKSYWAADIPLDVVKRAIENSFCFGMYHNKKQVGYARVITDFATTAYVGDVFILEDYRGHGLGKWMVETIVKHPSLDGLRLWFLGTRDAHGLYEKYGFKKVAGSGLMDRLMAILNPDVYKRTT